MCIYHTHEKWKKKHKINFASLHMKERENKAQRSQATCPMSHSKELNLPLNTAPSFAARPPTGPTTAASSLTLSPGSQRHRRAPTWRCTTLACLRIAMMSPTTVTPSSFMISLLRSSSMLFWILQGRTVMRPCPASSYLLLPNLPGPISLLTDYPQTLQHN